MKYIRVDYDQFHKNKEMAQMVKKLVGDYGFYFVPFIICTDKYNFCEELIEKKKDKHRHKIMIYRYIYESGVVRYALCVYTKKEPVIYYFNMDKYSPSKNGLILRNLKYANIDGLKIREEKFDAWVKESMTNGEI